MPLRTNLITTALIALAVFFYGTIGAPLYAAQQDSATTNTSGGNAPIIPAAESSASLNWAGYVADSAEHYTSVTGSWVVPTISPETTDGQMGRADATWVGIGGVNSHDLIQAGTQAIVTRNGSLQYQAWYEVLPDVSTTVSLAVSPGDSMTTTLTQTAPGQWQIVIKNNTTGKQYEQAVLYRSSLSSAEWVEERVSDVSGYFLPLDNFGSVKFFNASATADGQQKTLSELGAEPLSMIDDTGQPLATTSAIDQTTGAFTVARSDGSVFPQTIGALPAAYIVVSSGSRHHRSRVYSLSW